MKPSSPDDETLGVPLRPTEGDSWGAAPSGASEPHLEPFNLKVTNDSLEASGDARTVAAIHGRQVKSNDLQKLSKNILAALFLITGAAIIVFGPQNNGSITVVGIVLIVVACGTFGFTNINLEVLGAKLKAGQQPEPESGRRTWRGAIWWMLLGAVITGGAIYAWRLF